MDSVEQIKQLAGINNNCNKDGQLSTIGSNISITGMEKQQLERKHNIKPGTPEWFRLWFSKPYLTGETPVAGMSK